MVTVIKIVSRNSVTGHQSNEPIEIGGNAIVPTIFAFKMCLPKKICKRDMKRIWSAISTSTNDSMPDLLSLCTR